MKIITLNTWGGIAGADGLVEFFKKHHDVDVFCLQEIFNGGEDDPAEQAEEIEGKVYNLLSLIKAALPDHQAFFRPSLKDYYGLAMLIRNNFDVIDEGERFVHKEKGYTPTEDLGNHPRNIQYATIQSTTGPLTIINFHGLWTGGGKTDTQDRLDQSKKILDFIQTLRNDFVLCGDFNLLPETESLQMFEKFGLKNLIKEYGITSTRTSYYNKPQKYADYIFVTPHLSVEHFEVLPEEVSDHSALKIEIK